MSPPRSASRTMRINPITALPEYLAAVDQLIADSGCLNHTHLVIRAIREYAERRGVALPPRLDAETYDVFRD